MRKSPCTPFRVKAKGKENKSGFLKNPLSPRGRALVRWRGESAANRYDLAGAGAAEVTRILGARRSEGNIRLWAWYCYHHDIGIILDKACEIASRHRQGELKNPVTAFQRWLSAAFAGGGAE